MSNHHNPAAHIVTDTVRLSYVHVFEPQAASDDGKPKYSVSVIIPKSDKRTIAKINRAIQAAYEDGAAKLKGNGKTVPALDLIKNPLRDGDRERPDDEAYAGSYFVNATSIKKPGLVDKDLNQIIDREEIYSGVYARVSLTFYAFALPQNKGIACGLENLQKVRDGEPLGVARISAHDEFAAADNDDWL